MLSRMHNKLGTAGLVVAIVALIAALTGAAYAAGGLTKSQEKQVTKIAKKYAGKNGKDGATGPAGAQGAKGDKGEKGDKGDTGNPGQNGTFSTEPLPTGQTLTGVWSSKAPAGSEGSVTISYPIQVEEPAPTAIVVIDPNGAEGITWDPSTGEGTGFEGSPTYLELEAEIEALCPGAVSTPIAEPGTLCVYMQTGSFAETNAGMFENPPPGLSPDPAAGAIFPVGPGLIKGSWAVKAS